jgi:hypothetical protein
MYMSWYLPTAESFDVPTTDENTRRYLLARNLPCATAVYAGYRSWIIRNNPGTTQTAACCVTRSSIACIRCDNGLPRHRYDYVLIRTQSEFIALVPHPSIIFVSADQYFAGRESVIDAAILSGAYKQIQMNTSLKFFSSSRCLLCKHEKRCCINNAHSQSFLTLSCKSTVRRSYGANTSLYRTAPGNLLSIFKKGMTS